MLFIPLLRLAGTATVVLYSNCHTAIIMTLYLAMCTLPNNMFMILNGPKSRVPTVTYPAYQHMTFPTYMHIWQRIGQYFMQTSEICRKSCPMLQVSYMYEIQIFI